jgi:hypothetical protein
MSNLKDIKIVPVKIMLDKERTLLLDLNAFAELEEVYESVDDALDGLQKGKIKAVRAILWAGLVHEDEELTQKDVGKLIGFSNLQEISAKINEAFSIHMSDPEPEDESGEEQGTDPNLKSPSTEE